MPKISHLHMHAGRQRNIQVEEEPALILPPAIGTLPLHSKQVCFMLSFFLLMVVISAMESL